MCFYISVDKRINENSTKIKRNVKDSELVTVSTLIKKFIYMYPKKSKSG